MAIEIEEALWPFHAVGDLIAALSHASKLPMRAAALSRPHADLEGPKLSEWMEASAAFLGVEAEVYRMEGGTAEKTLAESAPSVVKLPGGFLGIVKVRGSKAIVLCPSLAQDKLAIESISDALAATAENPLLAEVDAMLDLCNPKPSRRARVRRQLLRERIYSKSTGMLWQLRTPAGAPFRLQMVEAGLHKRLASFLVAHFLEYSLWLFSWYLLGNGALTGRLDASWLYGWALLLISTVPFRVWTIWSQGQLALGLGGLLKQRLLAGALNLDSAVLRKEGAGRLLGRTLESDRVEALALSGGLGALMSVTDVLLSLYILANGATGAIGTVTFALLVGVTVWMAARYGVLREVWTDSRLSMTHELVEKMTGHRTRLAQQAPEDWHTVEDQQLESYLRHSVDMDRWKLWLTAAVPRLWLVLGLVSLAPAFLSESDVTVRIAVGLGGILAGYAALRRLTQGLAQLWSARISWRQVQPLFDAAAKVEALGAVSVAASPKTGAVLEAHDLVFRHDGRAHTVIDRANLRINEGDWLLLEGESGSGKSTLVSLLCGLRPPSSGLLLSNGLDQPTIGMRAWRRRVAAAPQYHENHVLAATLLFNLLMGRHWPPTESDVKEAEAVCHELGLGPLLERMPGGLTQMVGETGWQLSQGERGRVFLARALLQQADLVVLDESFAALDPETMKTALACSLRRAKTLLVVAHP